MVGIGNDRVDRQNKKDLRFLLPRDDSAAPAELMAATTHQRHTRMGTSAVASTAPNFASAYGGSFRPRAIGK